MVRIWTFLALLFVAYGIWMVVAAPDGERIVFAIPFLFWIGLFVFLAVRARRSRLGEIVGTNVYPYVPKIVRKVPGSEA